MVTGFSGVIGTVQLVMRRMLAKWRCGVGSHFHPLGKDLSAYCSNRITAISESNFLYTLEVECIPAKHLIAWQTWEISGILHEVTFLTTQRKETF